MFSVPVGGSSLAFVEASGEVTVSTLPFTIIIIVFMLILNALYVAAEFATVGARKSRIQTEAEGGSKKAKKLFAIVDDHVALDNYVATCQVGITLSSLVAGIVGQRRLTPLFEPLFGSAGQIVSILVVLLIVTALQVIFGELLPKTGALRYAERIAIATYTPMAISQKLLRPLVVIFNGSAFAIMRALRLSADVSHSHVHSPEELRTLFNESAAGGLIDTTERDMVEGVLNVEQRLVREIMTPRRRLDGITGSETLSAALARVVETPHSRFPVWADDSDDVLGIVHLRALYLGAQSQPNQSVSAITRKVLEVTETLTVPSLWERLDETDQHCAFVVNEYGDIAGMVTIEDAVEEVFGEVRDEFDVAPDPIVVENGRVSVSGEVLIEDVNRRFDMDLSTVDVDTVGGLIWHELSRLPNVGEEIQLSGGQGAFRVDATDGNAIDRVSFTEPPNAKAKGKAKS